MNYRGNIPDIAFGMTVFFSFAIIVIMLGFLYGSINDTIQDTGVLSTEAAAMINDTEARFAGTMDAIMPFILVGVLVGIIGLAFLIRSQPHLAIIGVFTVAIFVFVGAILSNAFFDLTSGTSALTTEANTYTMTTTLFTNLPVIIAVMMLLVGVILYAKTQSG